jgi:hypothetical protein
MLAWLKALSLGKKLAIGTATLFTGAVIAAPPAEIDTTPLLNQYQKSNRPSLKNQNRSLKQSKSPKPNQSPTKPSAKTITA